MKCLVIIVSLFSFTAFANGEGEAQQECYYHVKGERYKTPCEIKLPNWLRLDHSDRVENPKLDNRDALTRRKETYGAGIMR